MFLFLMLCVLCLNHLRVNKISRITIVLFICFFVIDIGGWGDFGTLVARAKDHKHNKKLQNQYDSILIARCMAKCGDKRTTSNCVKTCVLSPMRKLGECPSKESMTVFERACLNVCQYDSDCSDTLKCCKHSCGVTCQRATSLHENKDLPLTPYNLTISERRRSKGMILKWHHNNIPSQTKKPSQILYVIEERHHAGHHFIESRLGPWSVRQYTVRAPAATLRNVVKPGRWYQFRVAAVNENGTRGYSEPSKQFTPQYGPKVPGAPGNLTVGPLWTQNGTLWGELRWTPPASDLPILRYKVFWSRRLQGATSVLDSVLVNHQTVPKEETSFLLKELQVGFQYFLQVQALSQFGRNRLKGEKAAIILNTTNHTTISDITVNTNFKTINNKAKLKVQSLTVQKIFWAKKRLMARILWKPPPPATSKRNSNLRYTVSWWIRECHGSKKHYSTHLQQAVTTQNTRYDIYDLHFECKYRVSVQIATEGTLISHESVVIFTTPSCDYIRNKTEVDHSPKCA